MTWDPPRPRRRRTQLLTMGATWMLGYTVEAPSEDFIRIFKRMTLAEPRESTSRHAQYLTGPMTVSEGGRVQGDK